jgi:hypothetical protein
MAATCYNWSDGRDAWFVLDQDIKLTVHSARSLEKHSTKRLQFRGRSTPIFWYGYCVHCEDATVTLKCRTACWSHCRDSKTTISKISTLTITSTSQSYILAITLKNYLLHLGKRLIYIIYLSQNWFVSNACLVYSLPIPHDRMQVKIWK